MGTHRAWGSGKTSSWICIMRSPPGANSVTKQVWLGVWKQARRDSRKGCPVQPTASRIRFSQYRLQGGGRGFRGEEKLCRLCPATHMTARARWVFRRSATQAVRECLCIRGSRGSLNLHDHHYPILQMKTLRYRDKRGPAQTQAINNRGYSKENLGLAGPQSHLFKAPGAFCCPLVPPTQASHPGHPPGPGAPWSHHTPLYLVPTQHLLLLQRFDGVVFPRPLELNQKDLGTRERLGPSWGVQGSLASPATPWITVSS